ncbi:predicted protein [Verticillium alfalfae VaMs.102]|uniref:Predicted protein n=1 Tax=Verticillium alfalfae (strain VaMs.102 / ATCC MYA-4576 / FGSC 10136) TaxID=526221 RepID=C9SUT9_VERA1|nr:predicted protein [Verticillium alfalfae VaMs.102]EEY22554.1 predicted protein [Verticillium alfalfae VaMs.102]
MTSASYGGRSRKGYLDIPSLELTSLFLHTLCFPVRSKTCLPCALVGSHEKSLPSRHTPVPDLGTYHGYTASCPRFDPHTHEERSSCSSGNRVVWLRCDGAATKKNLQRWPSSEAKGPLRRGTQMLGGEPLKGSQGKMRRGTTKRHSGSNKDAHHQCEEAPHAHMPRNSSSAHKAARLNAGARREMCDWSTVCAYCWGLMQTRGPTDNPPEAFALSNTAGGRPRICNSKLA